MNKDKYIKSMEELKMSDNFNEKTAKLMKEAVQNKKVKNMMPVRKLAFSLAGAAIIVSAGVFAANYNHIFSSNSGVSSTNENSYTVAEVKLPGASTGEVNARMMPLFVYQGKVYIHYNTAIVTPDGYTVSEEDMLNLRGDLLGKTTGGIDELSGQDAYSKDFASNMGESEVYTVKGYDSEYRLMVYTKYEGGFSCEIYDSFGGLTLNSGADYFDILKLKENIASYQWESFDSWNNGKNEHVDAVADDTFNTFLDKLYDATPMEGNMDMLIDDTSSDSQKFLYLQTKDNLITSVRLLKDGYVYVPQVGFFQVDKAAFDDFYNSLQVTDAQ